MPQGQVYEANKKMEKVARKKKGSRQNDNEPARSRHDERLQLTVSLTSVPEMLLAKFRGRSLPSFQRSGVVNPINRSQKKRVSVFDFRQILPVVHRQLLRLPSGTLFAAATCTHLPPRYGHAPPSKLFEQNDMLNLISAAGDLVGSNADICLPLNWYTFEAQL